MHSHGDRVGKTQRLPTFWENQLDCRQWRHMKKNKSRHSSYLKQGFIENRELIRKTCHLLLAIFSWVLGNLVQKSQHNKHLRKFAGFGSLIWLRKHWMCLRNHNLEFYNVFKRFVKLELDQWYLAEMEYHSFCITKNMAFNIISITIFSYSYRISKGFQIPQ